MAATKFLSYKDNKLLHDKSSKSGGESSFDPFKLADNDNKSNPCQTSNYTFV